VRILTVGLFTCWGAYYMAAAAADEPKQQSSAATQSVQAPATAAPACTPSATTPCTAAATANTTVATASPATASKELQDAQDKALRSRGYKVQVRNGTTYYCRRETVLGSHFESNVCNTSDQLRATQQDSQDAIDKVTRDQPGVLGK
jgi:hypothetical protein